MKYGLYVPVYNAEDMVEKNIRKIQSEVKDLDISANIWAVNDNSTDNTPKILKKLEKDIKNFGYKTYKNGPSRRENLSRAMMDAEEEFVILMDVDLATDMQAFGKLVSKLKTYPIVIGSRYHKDSDTKRTAQRLIISKCYNSFIRLFFGSRLKDHQCGFKGFKTEAFKRIGRIAGYDSSFTRGWFWDVEVMVIAQKLGYRIGEIPVSWEEGETSTFSVLREMRMLPYVFFRFPFKISKSSSSNHK